MEKLAYSLHLGSDKNRKSSSKKLAKQNASGTTSMSNNTIQNATTLSRVDKHNYRKYDDRQDEIVIVRGTTSLYNDVKELYKSEFEEARLEYNEKQKRDDRKINDYFSNISNDKKHDLACEIIIELGNKKYWDTKDMNFKKKMTEVYKKQVEDLELLVPNFKVASAIIHYDETSPHMHIVGIPIKEKSKYGMSKQVGKSDVFTKLSLIKLQDEMRSLCIEEFNKEYGLNNILKKKRPGRNDDINVKNMGNYMEMQEQLERHQENLEKANQSSTELKEKTSDIKELVRDLKNVPLSKTNYILKEEEKNKLIDYIDKVDKTNIDYQTIQELSVTLVDVDEELEENREKIKVLEENNNAKDTRIRTLEKRIKEKDNEIDNLKEENFSLKSTLQSFKNKFTNLLKLIGDKMFSKHDREKYHEVANDLYRNSIIDENEMYEIHDDYKYAKERESKNRNDDFEL